MNRTSTNHPRWKIECDEFRKLGKPFKLGNASTVEHMAFIQAFCMTFEWTAKQLGETVIFFPPALTPAQ